jgi:hypothetical protein
MPLALAVFIRAPAAALALAWARADAVVPSTDGINGLKLSVRHCGQLAMQLGSDMSVRLVSMRAGMMMLSTVRYGMPFATG